MRKSVRNFAVSVSTVSGVTPISPQRADTQEATGCQAPPFAAADPRRCVLQLIPTTSSRARKDRPREPPRSPAAQPVYPAAHRIGAPDRRTGSPPRRPSPTNAYQRSPLACDEGVGLRDELLSGLVRGHPAEQNLIRIPCE